MFDKHTKKKARQGYRLSIVDKYCRHMNLSFFDYWKTHWIIVIILLLHFTYRISLLYVSSFLSLSKAYSKDLSDFRIKS